MLVEKEAERRREKEREGRGRANKNFGPGSSETDFKRARLSSFVSSPGFRATTVVIKEIERNNGDYVVTIDRRARERRGRNRCHTAGIIFLAGVFSRRGGVAAPPPGMKNDEKTSGES